MATVGCELRRKSDWTAPSASSSSSAASAGIVDEGSADGAGSEWWRSAFKNSPASPASASLADI
ncbi:unnamed protein product [Chondrus crispus]|uniref:Uncharacterized protein n=1 Tax=Chondrus crispus TaxID=2769 RepID=R7QDI4_CHOCR|nr:unnamed protein product [Chondrus crispus]CDF35848.1 unnamed protein product [Chondrus crispus]|eukprot:XP_005715667.1 unnamed protein product [Chondrus crispus]